MGSLDEDGEAEKGRDEEGDEDEDEEGEEEEEGSPLFVIASKAPRSLSKPSSL